MHFAAKGECLLVIILSRLPKMLVTLDTKCKLPELSANLILLQANFNNSYFGYNVPMLKTVLVSEIDVATPSIDCVQSRFVYR